MGTGTQSTYTPYTIDELVRGLDPADWVQLQLLARLSPAERVLAGMRVLAFGVHRATFDIDILVDLGESDVDDLAARFPLPRYYADPEMIEILPVWGSCSI